jgi:aromatic-L-amino-acid decarboxylase
VLRWYGTEAIRAMLRTHLDLADYTESLIKSDNRFEIVTARHFNLVCFRFKGSDNENLDLLERINRSGKLFLSHTKVDGKIVLRLVTGQIDLEKSHLDEAWGAIQDATISMLNSTSNVLPTNS